MRTKLGKPPKSKKSDGLSVELDSKSAGVWNLFGKLDQRAEHLRRMIPYIAAHETYFGVMSRIPGGKRYAAYRKILKVVRAGAKDDSEVFAVYGKPKSRSAESLDASRTLVYVQVKRNRMTPPGREVMVLAKYSPWTLETLPFSPKKGEALMVVRKVSRNEVKSVTKQRLQDKTDWKVALEDAGVRHVRKEGTPPPELKTKMVQDVAFDALRLEFGYGGVRAAPHWRPAVTQASEFVRRLWKTKNDITAAVFKPKNNAWKKWPPKVDSVRIADLKNLAKFQKRLRIRV